MTTTTADHNKDLEREVHQFVAHNRSRLAAIRGEWLRRADRGNYYAIDTGLKLNYRGLAVTVKYDPALDKFLIGNVWYQPAAVIPGSDVERI